MPHGACVEEGPRGTAGTAGHQKAALAWGLLKIPWVELSVMYFPGLQTSQDPFFFHSFLRGWGDRCMKKCPSLCNSAAPVTAII